MRPTLQVLHNESHTPFKDYINPDNSKEPKSGVLFKDFASKVLITKSKRYSKSHKKRYGTLFYHLDRFCDKHSVTLYTNSITEEFLNDFMEYLEGEDLKKSYLKATIDFIKGLTRLAGTYGYLVDKSYDLVKVEDEQTPAVYLSPGEIARIYYFKGLSKKQERIRDLFIVGCLTGLRYSDYSTLTPLNFDGDFIRKLTKKTKVPVIIPLHDYIKEIYIKYDGVVSSNLSNQHFNRYLKRIMYKIGMDDIIIRTYTKGGRQITDKKYKWQLISSHTARRSAATNMYLTGRFRLYQIMAITGHTTEKSFFRYICITQENISKQIAGDEYFTK